MARKKILENKNQIMSTALRLIETEGVSAVTMVRLSKELGVSSMTLYNYVHNAEDVLREILVQSFSQLYERIHQLLLEMPRGVGGGFTAYVLAYSEALFEFSQEHRNICSYLIGEGYVLNYKNAELRLFYDPFVIFLLGKEGRPDYDELRDASHLIRCMLFSLIREHIVGIQPLDKEEFLRLVKRAISNTFPLV